MDWRLILHLSSVMWPRESKGKERLNKSETRSLRLLTSRQRQELLIGESWRAELLTKLKGEESGKRWRENRILPSYNKTIPVAFKLSECSTLFLSQNWPKSVSLQKLLTPDHISLSFYLFQNIFIYSYVNLPSCGFIYFILNISSP